jgi:hypothetical protein
LPGSRTQGCDRVSVWKITQKTVTRELKTVFLEM